MRFFLLFAATLALPSPAFCLNCLKAAKVVEEDVAAPVITSTEKKAFSPAPITYNTYNTRRTQIPSGLSKNMRDLYLSDPRLTAFLVRKERAAAKSRELILKYGSMPRKSG